MTERRADHKDAGGPPQGGSEGSPPEGASAPVTDDSLVVAAEAVTPEGRRGQGFGRALSWSYVLTGGRTVVTLFVSLLLARLLGPEIFGTIAMANVFVLFVQLFVGQGLIPAIVQRPRLTAEHLDTAFWMTMAAVAVLVPATVLASGWWGRINDMPQLQPLIVALSATLLLRGLSLVQEARIRRRMDFRALAVRTNLAVVIGGVVGVSAAFAGAGVWALVGQQLTTSAIELVAIWRLSDWRPRWRVDRTAAAELFAFSGRSALASFGSFVNLRSDALLIGLFFGPVVVGLYRMAVRFIDLTLEIAAGALQSVFLPELSRYAEDPTGFRKRTVEVVRVGSLLAVPLLGSLAAASDPLMSFLGEQWLPAAPALRALCILAAVQAMSMFLGPILQAAGRPGVFAALTWTSAVLSAGSFVAAGLMLTGFDLERQVTLLALTRVVVFVPTLFLIVLPVLRSTVGLPARGILGAIWPASLAAVLGYLAVVGLRAVVGDAWLDPPLLGVGLAGAAAGAVGFATVVCVDASSRAQLRAIRTRLRDRRPVRASERRPPR